MLDLRRDPRADEPALPAVLGEDDAPFFSPLDDLAELASNSFRNCSLFMFVCLDPSKATRKGCWNTWADRGTKKETGDLARDSINDRKRYIYNPNPYFGSGEFVVAIN